MALGSYRNSPFVTGQDSATNGLKTEILNLGSGEWEQAGDYPFSYGNRYVSKDFIETHSTHRILSQKQYYKLIFRIAFYATASTSESVLIIGGYNGGSYISTIAEYKDGSWKNVGNLAQARHAHGAITSGSSTMVVGGYPNDGETT